MKVIYFSLLKMLSTIKLPSLLFLLCPVDFITRITNEDCVVMQYRKVAFNIFSIISAGLSIVYWKLVILLDQIWKGHNKTGWLLVLFVCYENILMQSKQNEQPSLYCLTRFKPTQMLNNCLYNSWYISLKCKLF